MSNYSSLLFAQPTVIEGFGRLVDFAGILGQYNYSQSPAEADRIAIASDWRAIGDDFRAAIQRYAARNGIAIRNG